MHHANINQKKARVPILISNKIDLRGTKQKVVLSLLLWSSGRNTQPGGRRALFKKDFAIYRASSLAQW